MESRVIIGKKSVAISVFIMLVFVVAAITLCHRPGALITIGALFVFIIISALLYSPSSVSVDDEYLTVHSPCKAHRIPIAEIVSVGPIPPLEDSFRIIGSGGFMGYWGIFRAGGIGKYKAIYGRDSDLILVSTKDGMPYVIGCENRKEVIDQIRKIGRLTE